MTATAAAGTTTTISTPRAGSGRRRPRRRSGPRAYVLRERARDEEGEGAEEQPGSAPTSASPAAIRRAMCGRRRQAQRGEPPVAVLAAGAHRGADEHRDGQQQRDEDDHDHSSVRTGSTAGARAVDAEALEPAPRPPRRTGPRPRRRRGPSAEQPGGAISPTKRPPEPRREQRRPSGVASSVAQRGRDEQLARRGQRAQARRERARVPSACSSRPRTSRPRKRVSASATSSVAGAAGGRSTTRRARARRPGGRRGSTGSRRRRSRTATPSATPSAVIAVRSSPVRPPASVSRAPRASSLMTTARARG